MCIFCGGACGGAGDVLLPAISAAVPLLTLKIRARILNLRKPDQLEPDMNSSDTEKCIIDKAVE
jgi:hypothetical protein